MNLKQVRRRLNEWKAEQRTNRKALDATRLKFEDAKDEQAAVHEAIVVVQQLAQTLQDKAHSQLKQIVSRCLSVVMEDDAYEFDILFEQKRNKTEARLVFYRGELEVDPMTAAGGTCVDLVSFALRLSLLVFQRPAGRRLLVLDEPFKFVSRDYLPRVRQLLEALSEELDIQFIIVTHLPELTIGKVVEL